MRKQSIFDVMRDYLVVPHHRIADLRAPRENLRAAADDRPVDLHLRPALLDHHVVHDHRPLDDQPFARREVAVLPNQRPLQRGPDQRGSGPNDAPGADGDALGGRRGVHEAQLALLGLHGPVLRQPRSDVAVHVDVVLDGDGLGAVAADGGLQDHGEAAEGGGGGEGGRGGRGGGDGGGGEERGGGGGGGGGEGAEDRVVARVLRGV